MCVNLVIEAFESRQIHNIRLTHGLGIIKSLEDFINVLVDFLGQGKNPKMPVSSKFHIYG